MECLVGQNNLICCCTILLTNLSKLFFSPLAAQHFVHLIYLNGGSFFLFIVLEAIIYRYTIRASPYLPIICASYLLLQWCPMGFSFSEHRSYIFATIFAQPVHLNGGTFFLFTRAASKTAVLPKFQRKKGDSDCTKIFPTLNF